jgi:hypothetical protein
MEFDGKDRNRKKKRQEQLNNKETETHGMHRYQNQIKARTKRYDENLPLMLFPSEKNPLSKVEVEIMTLNKRERRIGNYQSRT